MRIGPKHWMASYASKNIRQMPSVAVDGLRLFYDPNIGEARRAAVVERLTNAISFIVATEPHWLQRLQRGGTDLLLALPVGTHGYLEGGNVIILDVAALERQTPTGIQTSLVHEAIHARIALSGVCATRSNINRIERRCVEEEISYVRRTMARAPESKQAEVDAWAARKRQTLQDPWWTPRKRLGRVADLWAQNGVPLFIVRLMWRIAGRRPPTNGQRKIQ